MVLSKFYRLLVFGLKAMTTSLHTREVLLCMGGPTTVKKLNISMVAMILCHILCFSPTVNLDGMPEYPNMEYASMKLLMKTKILMKILKVQTLSYIYIYIYIYYITLFTHFF